VPARLKFNRAIAARVVALLAAGASRRQAAHAVGIHHSQIARWVARGDRQLGSGTRFDSFARAVHLAETPSAPPILVALKAQQDRWEAHPFEALKFLEETEFTPPPDPPIRVEVAFSPNISKETRMTEYARSAEEEALNDSVRTPTSSRSPRSRAG
jgi:hypothetical protein